MSGLIVILNLQRAKGPVYICTFVASGRDLPPGTGRAVHYLSPPTNWFLLFLSSGKILQVSVLLSLRITTENIQGLFVMQF